MKIHYMQHVPFEDPANIIKWALQKKHTIKKTLLYENQKLHGISDFDILIIMGGPMGVSDEKIYPWLKQEKVFIEKAILDNKKILGICLGAQLLADVLGASVYKNKYKEIGWFPVKKVSDHKVFNVFPKEFTAFHWHGDTYDIPKTAVKLAESDACKNQAFLYKNNVIGLQYHIESSSESIGKLINNCSDELINDKYIQDKDFIIKQKGYIDTIEQLLNKFLDNFIGADL